MSIAYDIALKQLPVGKKPKRDGKNKGWYTTCPNCSAKNKGWICDNEGKSKYPSTHCFKGCAKKDIIQAYKQKGDWPVFGKVGEQQDLIYYGHWIYREADGTPALKVVRMDNPDGGKEFFPYKYDDVTDSWLKSRKSSKKMPTLLFRLPEIIEAAKAGKPIFDVEGEKCVDKLVEHGFEATTINGGSNNMNNWLAAKPEKWCAGSKLIIVAADHDMAGIRSAMFKARHYYKHGFAVKFLTFGKEFGEIKKKGGYDVYDYLTAWQGTREKLLDRIAELPDWKPEDGDEEFAELFENEDKKPEGSNVVSISNPDEIVISPFCELATAYAFAKDYKEDALWVSEQAKWYVWNGKRWEPDTSGAVRKFMVTTIKRMYGELSLTPGLDRDKLHQWFRSALGKTWITHALYLAQPDMTFEYSRFNSDPFILNCNNGMVNLKTGELVTPHDKKKYCNIITPHDYPGLEGHSEAWQSSLLYAFGNNVGLHDYVQTLAGYAATGLAQEKKFFLFWGPQGDNLKSTIADGIKFALGPYAGSIDKRIIIQVPNENKYCDSSQLLGLRFGVMDEIYRRDKIDDGKFRKIFSGGDALRGSFVFKDTFDFDSQCTIIAFGNEKPHLDSGNNQASWNRVVVIPFKNKLPDGKVDRSFRDKLKQDASAILAWVVQGTLRYLHGLAETGDGLVEPPAVLEAIKEYKEEMDNMKDYLAESVASDPIGTGITLTDWYSDYAGWTKKSGFHAVSKKRFAAEIAAHGHVQDKEGSYNGIRLIRTPKSRYTG